MLLAPSSRQDLEIRVIVPVSVIIIIQEVCHYLWHCTNRLNTLGMSSAARVRQSFKSGAHGRRGLTQTQLMRSEIFETSMSWEGSVFGILCCYLREEGELACLCLVSALVIQPVLLCSVLRLFVRATGSGKYLV